MKDAGKKIQSAGLWTVSPAVAVQADKVSVHVLGRLSAKRAVRPRKGRRKDGKLNIVIFHGYSVLPARSSIRTLFRSKQFGQNSTLISSVAAFPFSSTSRSCLSTAKQVSQTTKCFR